MLFRSVTPGAFTFVEEGTNNGSNGFVCTNTGSITIGTTSISWVQFSGAGQITAGAGLTKTGNQLDVVGTANRITVNADNIDIAATYVGQTSITTLGTIGTGVWQGTIVNPTYGGTGVNNGSNTLTLAGNVNHAGAFTQTFTATANTSVTLPTTGTLATLANAETLSNKTITSSSFSGSTGAFTGNVTIGGTLGVTGASTLASATVSNLTSGRVTYAGASGVLQDSANLTFNGTTLTANTLAVTSNGTIGGTLGVTGNVTLSANLTGAGAATSTIDGFQIDGGTY